MTHFLRHSLRLCLLALLWALSACATDIKTSGTHAQFACTVAGKVMSAAGVAGAGGA